MLEETLNLSTPNGVAINFETYEDYDTYDKAFKGAIHAILIPFILAWVSPVLASGYLITAAFLYGTVFRHKSQGFWGTVVLVLSLYALLVMAV